MGAAFERGIELLSRRDDQEWNKKHHNWPIYGSIRLSGITSGRESVFLG